jgi:hypothetical protein
MFGEDDGKPLRFDISGSIGSNQAEDPNAFVKEEDVRHRDLQEFRDHPTLHLPSLRHSKKSRPGGLSKERQGSVLSSELLCQLPRLLQWLFQEGRSGGKEQKEGIIFCLLNRHIQICIY